MTDVMGRGFTPTNPKTATSSGDSLTLEDLERFINSDFRGLSRTLVAPNKHVAKEWAKQYPGWTIVLSARLQERSVLPTKGKE